MTIIPMRDLKDTTKTERLCAETGGPVFVTKNGYGRLVVMDIAYYEKLMGKIEEAKLINEGLSEIENGKTVDGDTVRARMKDKYGV